MCKGAALNKANKPELPPGEAAVMLSKVTLQNVWGAFSVFFCFCFCFSLTIAGR